MAKFHFFAVILFFILVSGCTESRKAELSIGDADVSVGILSNEDRILNISVSVHNIGEVDAQNVVVTAKARPANTDGGNVIIGSTIVTTIPSGADTVAVIVWDTKNTYSDNMVSVTVDPANSVEEYDKTNNQVLFAYSVDEPEHPAIPEGHPDI
jgi:subtilase family serine protease